MGIRYTSNVTRAEPDKLESRLESHSSGEKINPSGNSGHGTENSHCVLCEFYFFLKYCRNVLDLFIQSGASPDFITGVKAVIVDRTKERPNWSPASLNDVSAQIVANFFDPKSPYLSSAPEIANPAELTSGTKLNPMKYALPSEEEIGSVVTGSHASGGGVGIRFDELLKRFAELRPGKLGVKEKVYEVVQRRCEVTDNGDGNRVWLKWKHLPKERI